MMVACLFLGGRLLVVAGAGGIGARENCCFRMSAYVMLVCEYTGLLRHHGRREAGGSIPGGLDCRISSCRFVLIHSWASGKLF